MLIKSTVNILSHWTKIINFEQNTHNNENSKYTAQPVLNSEHFCIKGPLHQIHHLGFYSWKHLYIYVFYNFSMLFFLDSNWLELYKKFHGCRGPSHTHLLYHNALFIYKNLCISPIHRAKLHYMSYPLTPIWEMAWGRGGKDATNWNRVLTFLLSGTKKLTFSQVWIEHFKLINVST